MSISCFCVFWLIGCRVFVSSKDGIYFFEDDFVSSRQNVKEHQRESDNLCAHSFTTWKRLLSQRHFIFCYKIISFILGPF